MADVEVRFLRRDLSVRASPRMKVYRRPGIYRINIISFNTGIIRDLHSEAMIGYFPIRLSIESGYKVNMDDVGKPGRSMKKYLMPTQEAGREF